METSVVGSLGQPGLGSDLRALFAVMRREWVIFTRYPSWVIALFIWPLIFPMLYILPARARECLLWRRPRHACHGSSRSVGATWQWIASSLATS